MSLIVLKEEMRVLQRPWSGRPRHPFAVNRDSEQFQGLVAWWPCMPFLDLIDLGPNGRFRLTRNGPVWVADAEMGAVPEFDNAGNQYFEIGVPAVTAYPWTLAAWGWSNSLTLDQTLISVADKDVADQRIDLALNGGIAGDPVALCVQGGAGVNCVNTTTGYSANTWHHCCGVGVSATNRAVFKDGASKATTTTNVNPAGLDSTRIGSSTDLNGNLLSGRVADARIYSRVLSDSAVYRLWHPNTRWDLYYPLGRKTYVFFPSAAVEVCGPTFGLTDEAGISRIFHSRQDDTEEGSDLFTKIIHAIKDETQDVSDDVLTEIAGALLVLLTVDDALTVADEFLKQQSMGQQDDAGFQEAITKALHKVVDDGVLDVTDEAVSVLVRYLLAQDTEDVADLILKVVHAIRADEAATSDEFTKQQQAGHEDAQAQSDAFVKVLHAVKSDDQPVSDEALLSAIKYLLASEQIDLEDFVTKILHAVKAEDQVASDAFDKQQRSVMSDDQATEDTVVKVLAKLVADDQAVDDLIIGTLHKILGDDVGLPDEFVKHLSKVVSDNQDVTDEITAAIVARLVQLLLDDTAEASDETLKQIVKLVGDDAESTDDLFKLLHKTLADNQDVSDVITAAIVGRVVSLLLDDAAEVSDESIKQIRKIVADDTDLLDSIITQVTGLTLLVIDEALHAADEVLKAVHKVTDETGYIISDQAALQRVVEAVILERQEATDDFLKAASLVFGDEATAAEALVKAILKVVDDGVVNITDAITAEIVELVTVGFIQAMLFGVNDPQNKLSGIGRDTRLTTGVNDPQGKASGIARSPRLTSAIRDIMQIISDIKGTRK